MYVISVEHFKSKVELRSQVDSLVCKSYGVSSRVFYPFDTKLLWLSINKMKLKYKNRH